MTALEKLKKDHPHWDDEKLDERLRKDCPSTYGYLDDPDVERDLFSCGDYRACFCCWDREIPHADEEKLNDIISDARSLNHELCESELRNAVEKLKKDFGKPSTNKIGSIVLGIDVRRCSECDRGVNVLYLCDRRACKKCSYPECKHTTNIHHATNFKEEYGTFWEIDHEDDVEETTQWPKENPYIPSDPLQYEFDPHKMGGDWTKPNEFTCDISLNGEETV